MSSMLCKVPPEVREIIILLALPDKWNGKTLETINALRSDGTPYAEAIQAFHKMCYAYVLRRDWGFGDMKNNLISSVKKVTIILE